MPFCRKCGRRLVKYSESCPECKTSTTAPLIKIKKAQVTHSATSVAQKKITKAVIPAKPVIISVKVIDPTKAVKTVTPAKKIATAKLIIPAKPVSSITIKSQHKIIKSTLSLEEDIITNPQDYETQTFSFDLKCPHNHFWPAGKAVIVSNGEGYCLRCGERLRRPKSQKIRRHRSKFL
jgi:hypothetical protein